MLECEGRLIDRMLRAGPGDRILDVGCGTGIFSRRALAAGAALTGLELSRPMLAVVAARFRGRAFAPILGDMRALPFADASFDKAVSITALEFVAEAEQAARELFRVTRPGGLVVLATLNSLSPWAARRAETGKKGHALFSKVFFRSPAELAALSPVEGVIASAVHFEKEDEPGLARQKEAEGAAQALTTGAFLAACWQKPS